jgi:hypothetical protein
MERGPVGCSLDKLDVTIRTLLHPNGEVLIRSDV